MPLRKNLIGKQKENRYNKKRTTRKDKGGNYEDTVDRQ